METARPTLEEMVQGVTGVKVVSLRHDISTVTGEEVVRGCGQAEGRTGLDEGGEGGDLRGESSLGATNFSRGGRARKNAVSHFIFDRLSDRNWIQI